MGTAASRSRVFPRPVRTSGRMAIEPRCRIRERRVVLTPPVAAILERLESFDHDAAGELFDLVFEKVFTYAAACTRSSDDAAELTLAVLTAALHGLEDRGNVADDVELLSWLCRIARTRGADMYPRGQGAQSPPELKADASLSTVMDAVRALPRDERDVVVVHVMLGYDVDTTSRIVDLSPERVVGARHTALASIESAIATTDAVA